MKKEQIPRIFNFYNYESTKDISSTIESIPWIYNFRSFHVDSYTILGTKKDTSRYEIMLWILIQHNQEVRQYILEKKVDIENDFNFGSSMLWVFVILAIIMGIICIAKWM